MHCPGDPELSKYLDGEAGAATPAIERHLQKCPACARRLREVEIADIALFASLAEASPPEDLAAEAVPDPRLIARLDALGPRRSERASGRIRRLETAPSRRFRRHAAAGERRGRVAVLATAAGLAAAIAIGALVFAPSDPASGKPAADVARGKKPSVPVPVAAEPAPAPSVRDATPSKVSGAEVARARDLASDPDGILSGGSDSPATEIAVERVEAPAAPAGAGEAPVPAAEIAEGPPAKAATEPREGPAVAPPDVSGPAGVEVAVREPGEFEPFELAFARGDLRVIRRDGATAVGTGAGTAARPVIAPGDRLRAGAGGASFGLGRGIEVCLKPATELAAVEPAAAFDGYVIAIAAGAQGALYADVAPGFAGAGLMVETRSAAIRVEGTRFLAATAQDGATSVAVLEGAVLLSAAGAPAGAAPTRVERGQQGDVKLAAEAPVVRRLGASAIEDSVAWAERLRPRRAFQYQIGFEKGHAGWTGTIVGGPDAPAGAGQSPYAIAAVEASGNATWTMRAQVKRPGMGGLFRARGRTVIRFAYYLAEPGSVLVQARNESQRGDTFFYQVDRPVVGRWATVILDASELRRWEGNEKEPLREGDAFSTLEIYSGGPTGGKIELLVDDVQIYDREP